MATIVVTGGTDGIGRALAETYLGRGDNVLIIGRNKTKGTIFADGNQRAHFLAADLCRISENHRVIDYVQSHFGELDLLVLAARYHEQEPIVTADGFETTFALFYLSRYLLSHGLITAVAAGRPGAILNFGASWQITNVNWDDLQLLRAYNGIRAMGHAGHLNDLLAVELATQYADSGVRHIINHPGPVATSLAGTYNADMRRHIDELQRTAKPVETAIAQILPFLDHPNRANPMFVFEGRQVRVDLSNEDRGDANRLFQLTRQLLAAQPIDNSAPKRFHHKQSVL